METGVVRTLAALFAVGCVPLVAAAAQVPGTDIHLVELRVSAGRLEFGTPRNVTSRPGYDNQPAFTAGGDTLLYTTIGADGQADICRLPLPDGRPACLVSPATSEYSPTPAPGGGVSVVRVEPDSTQRLWRLAVDGGAELLLAGVRSVGYHAWMDADRLLLFVLGDPPTLQVADRRSGEVRVVGRDVGRSLHRIPGQAAMSFPQRSGDAWWITRLDLADLRLTPLIEAPGDAQDHAWLPDGTLLAASGNRLYGWGPGATGWALLAAFEAPALARITRIAVHPDGRTLALVGQEPAPSP